jgi:hypothetical protein
MTEPARLRVLPQWCWWLGFAMVAALALVLTIVAYRVGLSDLLDLAPQVDKLLHFSLAGLLVFFLDGALRRRTLVVVAGVAIPLAPALILVPSGIEEAMQAFAVHRTASVWDYAADVAGVTAFTWVSRRIAR